MRKTNLLVWVAALMLCIGCAQRAAPQSDDAAYPVMTVAVRRDAQLVSERTLTDEAEMQAAQEIVFDALVKSAAWPGVEASELEAYIALTIVHAPGDTPECFYQYDTDGRHVLQMGETGMYTVMGADAYSKLLLLAGLEEEKGG